MDKIITYSLKNYQASSDQYYRDISVFTDEVLAEAEKMLKPLTQDFISYLRFTNCDTERSYYEYVVELLTLGTLWLIYSGDALELQAIPRCVLTKLSKYRESNLQMKPGIDFLRGILSTVFLAPEDEHHGQAVEPNTENLKNLLNWLSATGEFKQEVKRLKVWQAFLMTLSSDDAANIIATCITFAAWFTIRSQEVLGNYTAKVEEFLEKNHASHRWREDYIFCGRQRVEYHLNMVGAEIMNRAFRDDFLSKKYREVLLPACMRIHQQNDCQASETALGKRCVGCAQNCNVNQLTEAGKKHSFGVLIVSHASNAFSGWTGEDTARQELAIVGIACVLNLISGGWKAKGLDIPAQCVLLDYCGCKNHWHETGIPTSINLNQLLRILGATLSDTI